MGAMNTSAWQARRAEIEMLNRLYVGSPDSGDRLTARERMRQITRESYPFPNSVHTIVTKLREEGYGVARSVIAEWILNDMWEGLLITVGDPSMFVYRPPWISSVDSDV